jgi:hypothetical protein
MMVSTRLAAYTCEQLFLQYGLSIADSDTLYTDAYVNAATITIRALRPSKFDASPQCSACPKRDLLNIRYWLSSKAPVTITIRSRFGSRTLS